MDEIKGFLNLFKKERFLLLLAFALSFLTYFFYLWNVQPDLLDFYKIILFILGVTALYFVPLNICHMLYDKIVQKINFHNNVIDAYEACSNREKQIINYCVQEGVINLPDGLPEAHTLQHRGLLAEAIVGIYPVNVLKGCEIPYRIPDGVLAILRKQMKYGK